MPNRELVHRRLYIDPTGLAAHIKSLSGRDLVHRIEVDSDPESITYGLVTCACEDYRFRHAKHFPTLLREDANHWCVHIRRLIKAYERRGVVLDRRGIKLLQEGRQL